MSVAKPKDMKEADMANIRIIKARFAKDGQTFKECKFNNDTLQIIIDDREYDYKYSQNKPKKYTDSDVEKMHDKINDPKTPYRRKVVIKKNAYNSLSQYF